MTQTQQPRRYEAPRLLVYGSLAELTQTQLHGTWSPHHGDPLSGHHPPLTFSAG